MNASAHPHTSSSNKTRPTSEIYIGLVQDLFGQAFTIGLVTVILACVGGYLAVALESPGMGVAAAAGVALGIGRLVFVAIKRRQIALQGLTLEQARRAERQYAALTFSFAAALGLTAAFAFLSNDSSAQLLVLALLFAYGSGITSRLMIRPRIAGWSLAIVAVIVTPAVAAPLTLPYLLLAATFVAFLVGGLVLVRGSYNALIEQLLTRNEFARLARYDYLTGLPNRLMLREKLDQMLAGDGVATAIVAVHHVDLDRFKAVNDTYGHPIGDKLLKTFGERLVSVLSPDDLAARFGGDEFVVLQAGAPSEEAIKEMAQRIIDEAQAPFVVAGKQISIGASVGVALAPRHGIDLDDLIGCADVALYGAKDAGRDGFVAYNGDATFDKIAS